MRQPLLPKPEKQASQDWNAYRKALHEDLYPKATAWTPSYGLVATSSVTGEYTHVAGLWFFSVVMETPTASVGAYFDLPFEAAQYAVFSVAISGTMKAATVDKGSSRVYLPDFGPVGRAVISGLVVA